MVNNCYNINKTKNNLSSKGSFNSEGQQFHLKHKGNNNLARKESLNSDGQQFHQNQQSNH